MAGMPQLGLRWKADIGVIGLPRWHLPNQKPCAKCGDDREMGTVSYPGADKLRFKYRCENCGAVSDEPVRNINADGSGIIA